ncbi:Tubulin polyglutamylase TTLL4 [Schistosoma japonicum]|nr:Tubulin polyglutamylase TTLL4 [Schistosoma japonicum]
MIGQTQFSENDVESFVSNPLNLHYCENYSRDKYVQTYLKDNNINKHCRVFSPMIRPSSSITCKKKVIPVDKTFVINEHRYDKCIEQHSDVDQICDQSDCNQELECLDDDLVIVDDNESAIDTSDSEESCTKRLSNIPDEILPPVIASLFPNTPSVLRFVDSKQTMSKLPKPYRNQLLWRPSGITPNVVKRVLRRSNFRITLKSNEWIGYYGNHLKPFGFRPIREYQKVNHFPGSFQLGRKDKLWMNINQLRSRFGKKSIDFVPRTFCLPTDLKSLKEHWTRYEAKSKTSKSDDGLFHFRPKWIMKPPASARGIGIKLIRAWSDIPKQRRVLVQSYINQPYLIDGKKFDIRLYVLVTGFSPFRAYVYREGLVRFASQKYSTSVQQLRNRFVHLTNYSVNKYNKTEEAFASNHKWKMSTLWSYLIERGVDISSLWSRIVDIIFKTLASVVSCITTMVDQNCRRRASVYELFGFDIILDADLKPWLLEVNVSPSLHTNTQLDDEVKTAVVKDMFNICGFQLPPNYRSSLSAMTPPSRSLNNVCYKHNDKNTNATGIIMPESKLSSPNDDQLYASCKYNHHINNNGKLSNQNSFHSSSVFIHNLSGSAATVTQKRFCSKDGLPPPSPSINNTCVKRSLSAVSVKTTASKLNDEKGTSRNLLLNNNQNRMFIDPCIPITDPRLWDISLSAKDKRKHLFYSSLMADKDKDKSSQFFNKLSKHSIRSTTTSEDDFKDPMNTLHHILLELTPDDLRTLVSLIDERYRAALGNFQCIFPIHGSEGYRLLTFLHGAYQENTYGGTLGSRSPFFYYYDILQYVFLTVYHNFDDNNNLSCDSFAHCYYEKILPDQILFISSELNKECLSIASKMTGVSITGYNYLIDLCKKGIHLSSSDSSIRSSQFLKPQIERISSSSSNTSYQPGVREYYKPNNYTSSVHKIESLIKNLSEDSNNIRPILTTTKCSNQTQTVDQYTYENDCDDDYYNQPYKSHDRSNSLSSKRMTASQPSLNIGPIQLYNQSNKRHFAGSTKNISVYLDNRGSVKTSRMNSDMSNENVDITDGTLKGSLSNLHISTNKKQTNFSSVQVQTPEWDENIFKSSNAITDNSNNYQELSCDYQVTEDTKSSMYSSSSSSNTTVASINSPKSYGYYTIQRISSERNCESSDETYKNDNHANQLSRIPTILRAKEQIDSIRNNNENINHVKHNRQTQQEKPGYQSNKYIGGMLNNHRRYHRIKSTSAAYPIRSYSEDRNSRLNRPNYREGSYEDVSMSSGYSSFVREKSNAPFKHLSLQIQDRNHTVDVIKLNPSKSNYLISL